MLGVTEVLVLLFVFLVTYAFFSVNRRPKNYPPGPFQVPFLGYIPFMNKKSPGEMLTRLAEKYGEAFSLKLGVYNVVYLNSWELASKALNHPDIAGRPELYTFLLIENGGKRGIGFSDGELYREQSQFAIRHLRSFGFGKRSFDYIILKEVREIIKNFAEKKEQPFTIPSFLNIAISNILWKIVADLEFDRSNPTLIKISECLEETMSKVGYMTIADYLPWLRAVLPVSWLGVDPIKDFASQMLKFTQGIIESHRKTFDAANIRDFVDAYIKKQKEDEENGVKNSTFTDMQLCSVMSDLFIGGVETTATALRFVFHFLICRQDIQDKLREDIYKVTNGEREVDINDRENLPYLEAFISEFLRLANISPLVSPHKVTSTVKIGNYVLPKDTLVIVQTRHIHLNPKLWPNPDKFDATRFLDEDGKVNRRKEGYLPFSTGKRMCPGESFTKMEMFLFLGNLLQDFTFSSPPGVSPPPPFGKGACGLIIHPPPFEMVAKPNKLKH